MSRNLAAALILLLVAAAACWLFLPQDRQAVLQDRILAQKNVQTPSAARKPVVQNDIARIQLLGDAPAPDAPPVVLDDWIVSPPPTLDSSDMVVLEAVNQLNPEVVQWLLPTDQIRKWVATVNLLAEGKFPLKDRPLEMALPPFGVTQSGGRLWMDRHNHRRVSLLVRALTQMPPSRVAKLYAVWRPLLQQAQDELGNGERFDACLQRAIARVLAVPALTGEVELKAGVMKYTYAQDRLEKASALEKALWRLGPANTLRIQNYLRALQPLL